MAQPLTLAPSDITLSRHTTLLSGAARGKYPDGNSVLVVGTEGVVLIDPSLTVHRRGGAPAAVDRILLSHAHEDHMSGIAAVQGATGQRATGQGATGQGATGQRATGQRATGQRATGQRATVHAHHRDLPCVHDVDVLLESYMMTDEDADEWRQTLVEDFHLLDQPAALGFSDGDVFDLGDVRVTVMHLPGHTQGHSAFLIEPDGVAFVGDIDLSSFGPYYGDHWSDLGEFVTSIERVRRLEANRYVTFHHKGVVEGHDEFIRQLDAFAAVIGQRDDRLLGLLSEPRTLGELAADGIIYRPGNRPPGWGNSVEVRSIDMHLERLIGDGIVVVEDGRFRVS